MDAHTTREKSKDKMTCAFEQNIRESFIEEQKKKTTITTKFDKLKMFFFFFFNGYLSL